MEQARNHGLSFSLKSVNCSYQLDLGFVFDWMDLGFVFYLMRWKGWEKTRRRSENTKLRSFERRRRK